MTNFSKWAQILPADRGSYSVTQPLLVRLFHRWPDLSDLRPLVGSRSLLALALLLTWTLAAFGEELVYRGYLMNRVADLFGRTRAAWTLSLILMSILFGFGHFDQGAIGQIENVIGGCLLGLFYLVCGQKLAVPVVAHGVQDTIFFSVNIREACDRISN